MVFGVPYISDISGRKKVLIERLRGVHRPHRSCLLIPQHLPVLARAAGWVSAMCATLTANDGTLSSYPTGRSPPPLRSTGFAFSFNLANAIFGGTASRSIATVLIALTGFNLSPRPGTWKGVVHALVAMILPRKHPGQGSKSHRFSSAPAPSPEGAGRIHRPSNPPPA